MYMHIKKLVPLFFVAAFWLGAQYNPPGGGGAPTGNAGGDLSGTYPNPTAAQLNGAAVPASAMMIGTNSSKQLVSVETIADTLKGNAGGGGVTSQATDFLTSWSSALGSVEGNSQWVVPVTGHLLNLYVTTSATQTSNGSLVFTVNTCTPSAGACTGSATTLTTTVAAGTTANIFTDTTHTPAVTAGQLLDFSAYCNTTSGTCAGIRGWTFQIEMP
jgi:hypothetical protein